MISSNDVQRLFLQAVLSRGMLSTTLARVLWTKCVEAVKAAKEDLEIPHSNENKAWDDFVINVNKSLDSLALEFRHLHDEVTGREMYAIVNRKGDEIAQMATDYSAIEIAYFKAIIEQIMLAPRESYSVSSLAALREVNQLKTNMSKTQAEVVLGSFVAKGWLLKSQRGRYSLSTRTLLELLPYLKSTYQEEILDCTICFEILTRGVACCTPNCKTRMHLHCFSAFRRTHRACPSCSKDWPQDAHSKPLIPVGEGAVKDGQDDGRRRVRRTSTAEGSDDEGEGEGEGEEMEDELDQSQSQSQLSQPKKSTRGKGKAKAKEASVEVDEDEDDPPPRTQANKRKGRR